MAHLFHPFQPLQSLQPFHSFHPAQSLEPLQPLTQLKSTLDVNSFYYCTSMYVDWYYITKQAYKWSKYKHIITHLKTFLTTIIWLLIKQPKYYRLYNASSISIVWGNVIIKFPLVIFENVQDVQCIFFSEHFLSSGSSQEIKIICLYAILDLKET